MGSVKDTHTRIAQVNELRGEKRSAALGQLIASLMPLFERYAAKEAENRRLPRHVVEDLVQEMALLAVRMVDEERDDPGHYSSSGHPWEALFTQKARNVLRSYLDGPGGSSMGGANGAARRLRYLSARRSELEAILMREPTKKELVDYANEHAAGRRANARRQGMVFSEADLSPTAVPVALSDVLIQMVPGSDESGSGRSAMVFARRVVARASARSVLLGEVAHVWLSDVVHGDGDLPEDWRTTCDQFGLTQPQASAMRAALVDIAASVRAE